MRFVGCLILLAGLSVSLVSCGPKKEFEGPIVDAFIGSVTHNGKPVTFPNSDTVSLKLIHETGQSFGIPIKDDGSFKIGWMPIGKYGVTLERPRPDGKGKNVYTVPGGLTVEQGKTDYNIELGKGWTP